MKKLLILFSAALMLFAGCTQFDDSRIWDAIDELEDICDDLDNRVEDLEDACEKMNTNIEALQALISALQNSDYITKVTPITDGEKTIGYTINFAKGDPITIYHGQDGKDGQNGQDGTDGKDGADGKDGYTPQIGVKQDTDGIYYWTLDGEWLTDENGNRIKAVGTDGKDGANGQDGVDGENGKDGADGENGKDGTDGADGKDGKDGITPLLKIENDYWYISYDNGTTWTQLGKATGEKGEQGEQGPQGETGAQGPQGESGANGDSFFQSVTQDEQYVYFTLADGTVITLPKGASLDITFEASDLVVMSPNSTREINYTVQSVTDKVTVEVTSSADIRAKVVTSDASGKTGKIKITTGATIDEYSKVIVFVSNGEKVTMKSITFEQAGLEISNDATLYAPAEGGNVTLTFLSNVECEVVIPEEAQEWISLAPITRAMTERNIALQLTTNEGYYRSVEVKVQSTDGKLAVAYTIEQDGDLGVYIDPTAVPDNEIWYRTTNGEIYDVEMLFEIAGFTHSPFDAKIISNVYSNGYGIIKFDDSVKTINNNAFAVKVGDDDLTCADNINEIYLPNGVETLNSVAIRANIKRLYIPMSLKTLEIGAIHDCINLEEFEGDSPFISEDKHSLIIDNTLYALASYGLKEYTIPSNVKNIADYAAYNCSLEKVIISENVQTIGDSAFAESSKLKIIEFHNGLEFIYGYAFNNTAVKALSFPNSLKEIWGYAFGSCDNLEEINLPNSLTGIGNGAFGGKSLTKITGKFASEDNRCIIIGGEIKCFAGAGLTNYTIPDGVVDISNWAFADNAQLESVQFPESIVRIGDYAFQNCSNLSCIFTSKLEYIGSHAFRNCNGFKEIILPKGVTRINEFTFANCDQLQSVTLSPYVSYIGTLAFGGDNVKSLYFQSLIPPTLDNAALDAGNTGNVPTIYVPQQSLIQYQNHSNYEAYKDYIVGYEYSDLPEPDYYISTDYSTDGDVTTLQTATQGKGIDIVLMGDAYSDRQIADGSYKADMENLYNNLFTEEPYKSFKDHFNVYYVNVVSATEGYEYGNTALGTYFGDGTTVGGTDNAVFNYAQKAIGEERMDEAMIVVAMNSDNYAGTCWMYYPEGESDYGKGVSISYFPRGGDAETFAALLHHEACGHGFAKLADEYAYEEYGAITDFSIAEIQYQHSAWGWWKNVDFTNDTNEVHWSHFLADERYANEGLGVFEGGLTYWSGVWRPSENSIMRYNTGGFNAPSREAIYYRIHKLAYGAEWEYDYEEFVEWDARNRTTVATRAMVYKPANYKPTHPPVIVNKSWKDAK